MTERLNNNNNNIEVRQRVSGVIIFKVPYFSDDVLKGSASKDCLQCWIHRRCRFNPWVGKIPLRRKWQPTLNILA